jgi:hypothetical protein
MKIDHNGKAFVSFGDAGFTKLHPHSACGEEEFRAYLYQVTVCDLLRVLLSMRCVMLKRKALGILREPSGQSPHAGDSTDNLKPCDMPLTD